jgi:hypothetical protein
MNEVNLLSLAEKIAWCRAGLRRLDELEAKLRQAPRTSEGEEALAQSAAARRVLLDVLTSLEHPTLWQRINLAVNGAAAKNKVREDLKRRRKPRRCSYCSGTGRRPAASGNYFENCPCGGVVSWYDGSAEVDEARQAAAQLRREMNQ